MLVTVDELAAYMNGLNVSDSQRPNIELVLAGVQNELEIHLNRPLEPVQVREAVNIDAYGVAYLKVTPVHRIISIESAPDVYDLTPGVPYYPPVFERDLSVVDAVDYTPDLSGYMYHAGGFNLGVPGPGIAIVNYIGGYIGYNDYAIKLAIMRVASREVTQQHGQGVQLRRGTTEAINASDERQPGWTYDEKESFSRLRRYVVV